MTSVGTKRRTAVVDQAVCVACGLLCKGLSPAGHQDHPGRHGPGQPREVRGLQQMRQGVSRQRHPDPGGGDMRKHWYDYLWIVSLLYLLLGFFNILFAWLGLLCFFLPLIISVVRGTKGYCNRYCGRGPALWAPGWTLRPVPKKGRPRLDEKPGLPVRLSGLLHDHVPSDAVEHLSGVRRSSGPPANGHPAVDLPAALALGLSRHLVPPRRGPSSPSAFTASCSPPPSWG